MRTTLRTLCLLLAGAAALAVPARAAAAPKVVTTVEGLAALAREVGGDRAQVESLSRGTQDPHFVDANPMLAVKLRNADLLVDVGLDLEIGWLPPLVNQSRNAQIQPGGARRVTAATFVHVLDVPTGPVDRSMGDLHPAGNPHFMDDPRAAVAAGVVEGGDGAIVLAQNEDRIRANLIGTIVPRLRDLRLAGYEQPVAREDVPQVGVKDAVVVEKSAGKSEPRTPGFQKASFQERPDMPKMAPPPPSNPAVMPDLMKGTP